MNHRDRSRVFSDLKNYRNWMDKEETIIFIKCIRFFMELDKENRIRSYEIYVIYSLIMVRFLKKC
jgi:hypothetical protein